MSDTENIVLIDWLTFTTTKRTVEQLIQFLGLDHINWIETKGHHGYKSAKQFGGIWIMYDGREDMGICVEMSGQGCRQFETSGRRMSLDSLAGWLADDINLDEFHITRLDVAYDDIDHEGGGYLDMVLIDQFARSDMYISRFRSKSGEWSGKHSDGDPSGPLALSVYFGSPQSNTRFRIYDKSLERGGLDYHWTRFELQLRDDSALNFLRNPLSVGEKFYGLINNNLRFIIPSGDSNRRRWDSPKWWTDFLESTRKISVFTKKDVEYNMSKLEHYVFDQAGKSIYTFIKCKGSAAFIQYLEEFMQSKDLNDNQLNLINEYATLNERKLLKYYQSKPKGRLSYRPDKGK